MSATLGPPALGSPLGSAASGRPRRGERDAHPRWAITNTRRNSESLHDPDLPQGQVVDAATLEAVPREAVTRHPIHAEPSTRTLLP
jgi:hypothetical protein